MGGEVMTQLIGQPKVLGVAGAALCMFGLVPGFPASIFCAAGGLLIAASRSLLKSPHQAQGYIDQNEKDSKAASTTSTSPTSSPMAAPTPTGPEAVLPLLTVDPIEIEIGYGLTKLADTRVGGDLPERITATRRQIALELGFVMPTVRIRDSVHLGQNDYILKIRGEEVVRSTAMADLLLAVSSDHVFGVVPGIPTKDPVFGLDALWIEPSMKENAERTGYTVIEPAAVLSTHLAELVKTHAFELLSRQDVQTLLDNARSINASVVSELVPNILQVGDVQKVLQHLLKERVPIRDMVTMLETLADFGTRVKDPDQLGELVRSAIGRTITRQFVDPDNKLFCLTLSAPLERSLGDALSVTSYGSVIALEPNTQQRFLDSLRAEVERCQNQGMQVVLLCGTKVRLALFRLIERQIPNLPILAYNEVSAQVDVDFVGQVQDLALAA